MQLKNIKNKGEIFLYLLLITYLSFSSSVMAIELFVATNGNDNWEGTIDTPLATLDAARDKARTLRQKNQNSDTVVINIRGGEYRLKHAFKLNEQDTGSIYQAFQNEIVRVTGGLKVKVFHPVNDIAVLNKLPENARGSVVYVDLNSLNISNVGELSSRGYLHSSDSTLELFIDSIPMPLARFPNSGWLTIKDLPQGNNGEMFTVDSDRLIRWENADAPWVFGYWNVDWADQHLPVKNINSVNKSITVATKHELGFQRGQRFYIQNLLEELDSPGEWYLDRNSKFLYLYPLKILEKSDVAVSVLQEPFIEMSNVSNVVVRGISFDIARGDGMQIRAGSQVHITQCRLSNIGGTGIVVDGGINHSLTDNEIFNIARGGIGISGGNRADLKSANHEVSNNYIHHFAMTERTYNPAIDVGGVGVSIIKNKIHDAPHLAIKINGNDHQIESNEIYQVMLETDDVGAIYMGRDWTQRGHVIRYNYIHHNGPDYARQNYANTELQYNRKPEKKQGVSLIYLDDMGSGVKIEGNILHGGDKTIVVGGGRDNKIENNILLGGNIGVELDARGLTWAKDKAAKGGSWQMHEKLQEVNYNQPPYSTKYPELATILSNEPHKPLGNTIAGNIFVSSKESIKLTSINAEAVDVRGNIELLNQQITENPLAVAKQLSQGQIDNGKFQAIPFEQIGLIKNDSQSRNVRVCQ